MEYGWMTHAFVWLVGLISVGGVVGAAAALWSMGRSGYRKD